jgi:hypothetical protein
VVNGQIDDRWAHRHIPQEWKRLARCRGEDPELWFPYRDGKRSNTHRARELTAAATTRCGACPVTRQ